MDGILTYLGENHIALGLVAFSVWSSTCLFILTIIQRLEITEPLPKVSKLRISEALVSALQGFICGGIGVLAVLHCKDDVMHTKYEPIVHYCTFGTGYFTYDLLAMFYANWLDLRDKGKVTSYLYIFKSYLKNNTLMIAHHIILTAILFPALITYSPMGHFFAGCFFCMELSSPFVNFRTILSKLGMKPTKLYLWNGITMMVVFAIFRVGVFGYMYIHYSYQTSSLLNITPYEAFQRIPYICHFFCTIIISPQLYWLSMMINGVFSVLLKMPKALDKYD